jgi:tetratricopeptide (TPR) repeat protein
LLWDAVTRLGATLDVVGERDGALRLYQELTDLAATTLGPVHPTTAGYLYSRGTAARRLGNHRLAAESFQRALDVWKEVAGRQDDGEKVAAMGGLASSLPAGLTRLAPWDYFAGLSADGLGDALAAMGRVPEARACYRQALACFEAGCGQEGTVDAYYIGELRTKLGRLGESGGS